MAETAQLAEFIASTSYEDIPDDVIERGKQGICDTITGILVGSREEDSEIILNNCNDMMAGDEVTVIGHGKSSLSGALFANGAFPLVIGAGDTFESVVIHPSPPIVPPLLSLAETQNVDGRSLVTGYVVGMETIFRIGKSTYPSHYEHWHGTGTIGIFGAAATGASILDLSKEEVEHVVGIAGTFSAGLKKNLGTRARPLHTGHAAQRGLQAVQLIEQGLTATDTVFDGEIGYGNAVSDNYNPDVLTEFGERWGVMDTMFKLYPSGFITHAAMGALSKIIEERDLDPQDVSSVVVELDESIEYLLAKDPDSVGEAGRSIEFCLAAIIREGKAGPTEFSESYFQDSETRKQMEKIEATFSDGLFDKDLDVQHGARVTVRTTAGDEYVRSEEDAPGGPSNPVAGERLREKFLDWGGLVLDSEDLNYIYDTIMDIEELDATDELMSRMRP